jgi:hypothetical protein
MRLSVICMFARELAWLHYLIFVADLMKVDKFVTVLDHKLLCAERTQETNKQQTTIT